MARNDFLKKTAALLLTGLLAFGGINAVNANSSESDFKVGEKFAVEELNLGKNAYVLGFEAADVTGDAIEDQVILVGQKLTSKDDIYAENINIVVQDGKSKQYAKATYENFCGYYSGELFIGDFTGDKVNDVMALAGTGGSGGIVLHLIATFKDNQPAVIFSEKDNAGAQFKGKFVDGFKVELENKSLLDKKITLDVRVNEQDYVKLGIYDKDGNLLAESEAIISAFAQLKPIDYNHDGVYELQGIQRVIGIWNADTISHLDSIWGFDDAKWNIQQLKYTTYILK